LFEYHITYVFQAEVLAGETMALRQQLNNDQEKAKTSTDPQKQPVYAAQANQTAGDLLDTEKEWRDKREADDKKREAEDKKR
jgi:hypothetical protein